MAGPGSLHAGLVAYWDQRQTYNLETGTRGKPQSTWEQLSEEGRGAPDAWAEAAFWSSEFSGWLACVAVLGHRSG